VSSAKNTAASSLSPTAEPLFADQWYLRNTGQSGGTPRADIARRAASEV